MRNIIAYLGCLLAVTACVKSIDLTTGDRLVAVECILADVAPQTLRLGLTTGPTGIEEEALAGAVATLTDLTEQKTAGVFTRADDGLWHLDYAAIPEHKYRLEVEVPGYGTTVWAEDTMPPAVDIYYERHYNSMLGSSVSDKDSFRLLFCRYVEAPLSMRPDDTVDGVYYPIQSVFYSSDSLPEHTLIHGFVYDSNQDVYRAAEMLCADTPGIDNCNLDGNVYKSPQRVMRMIPNPLSSESLKAFFEGLKKMLLNPKVDGYNCHSRYLKIEREQALSQSFFTISGDFREDQRGFGRYPSDFGRSSSEYIDTEVYEIPWTRGYDYLLFQALSENYNTYLNDAISSSKKSDNLASLYMRESCYTNIEGGVGLFGAVSTQKVPIDMVYSLWELTDDLNKWEVNTDV